MTKAFRVFDAKEFGPAEAALWESFRSASPLYRRPFFAPDFIAAVGAVRKDARVAFFESNGRVVTGFAFHRRPGGFFRPLAAPWSDWQGPLIAPDADIEPTAILDGCGGKAVRFTTLADPFDRFVTGRMRVDDAWIMDLKDGAAAYRATLQMVQKSNLDNTRRVMRKAEREIGPVQFAVNDPDRRAFEQLIRWKQERYRAEGSYDIISVDWVQALLNRLWEARSDNFGGALSTVRIGDRLAAATFHLREGDRWVAWIMGYDASLAAYGPGRVLIDKILDNADPAGLRLLDFGIGGGAYKSKWCLSTAPAYSAVWHGLSVAGQVRSMAHRGWLGVVGATGPAGRILERVRSRTDHLFSVHPRWTDASRGFSASVFGRRPKLASVTHA
jgi:CelD/BcsL family acetyltransferase involved in cellulose biosynthesis